MFKNILVPTDLSDKSKKAMDIAVSVSSKGGEAVTLLHVIEAIEGDDDDFQDFYERLRKRAKKEMDKIAAKYESDDIVIDKAISVGRRVPEIVRFANDHAIDLIILSSHRIENFETGEGWATISYKVGILAGCPVMMVK
ncbi:universal stress protein [Thermodesulfobacteriota bacterium]